MTNEPTEAGAADAAAQREIAKAGGRTRLVVAILLGIAGLYTLGTLALASGHVAAVTAAMPPAARLAQVLGLVLLGFALRAGRWQYFVRLLGWPVPFVDSIIVFIASFALTATPGKAGELLKSALLRARYGVPASQSAGVLIVERLGDLFALLALASLGLILFAKIRPFFLLCAAVALAAGYVLLDARLARLFVGLIARIAPLRPQAEAIGRLLESARGLLRPVPFLIGLAWALAGWSCEGAAFFLLCKGLAVSVPLPLAVSIYALASIAGALSMLPGGFGGVEAVSILLLTQLGATAERAAVTVVLFRLCTLYFATLLGIAFLGLWRLNRPREDR